MSRAYRIRVRETNRQVLKASDHVSTKLELLDILPPARTAELLGAELRRRGFEPNGKTFVRREAGVTIEVDPATAEVTVRAASEERAELSGTSETWGDRDAPQADRKKATEALREELRKDLQKQAEAKRQALQQQVTERLEGRLADLRRELDQVVNRVTADALKERAGQLGQIKELTEDPQSGSLTIVVEV